MPASAEPIPAENRIFEALMWTRSGSVGNNLKSLTIYLRGVAPKQQPIEETFCCLNRLYVRP
jgi:hypothetical protein